MTAPRILIIDEHADFRRLLGHHISARWPEATIRYVDLLRSGGRLPPGFTIAGADLVLVGQPSGSGEALECLRELRRTPRVPPIVFLGTGGERQIVEAIKAGAEDYLTRTSLTHARLVDCMERALAAGHQLTGTHRQSVDAAALRGFPGYELVRLISEGEISGVYLTRERSSGRMAVLKVLRQVPDSGSDKHFDRFLQEYELIARVDHPNVVRIFDLGVADDHAYIAMEYCSGGSLKRRITAGIGSSQAYTWMRVLSDALRALHAVGIYHRDLKPTNIMFREDGSPVLIDFGLAKEAHLKGGITGSGAIFGTPYYMSPEQGEGNPVDQRSDIYSLGVVFYEMLTGRKLYDGSAAMAVIIQHRDAPVPRLDGELAAFQPLVERMLAKKPEDRFQSVEELLDWTLQPGQLSGTAISS
jgi:serine/threonine protein kinase/CheY-like chemotaxis protein